MKVEGVTGYFRSGRRGGKHARVSEEVARSVAESRRSFFWHRPNDGRTEIFGYSPQMKEWVEVILNSENELLNGFTEPRSREIIKNRTRQGR